MYNDADDQKINWKNSNIKQMAGQITINFSIKLSVALNVCNAEIHQHREMFTCIDESKHTCLISFWEEKKYMCPVICRKDNSFHN